MKGYLSGGQRSLPDIYKVGIKQEGYSERMLQRCAAELGVVSKRVYTTYWALPAAPGATPQVINQPAAPAAPATAAPSVPEGTTPAPVPPTARLAVPAEPIKPVKPESWANYPWAEEERKREAQMAGIVTAQDRYAVLALAEDFDEVDKMVSLVKKHRWMKLNKEHDAVEIAEWDTWLKAANEKLAQFLREEGRY